MLHNRNSKGWIVVAVAALLAVAVVASTAFAHVERASYWPDPAADTGIKPAAGGGVPAARNLFTALDKKPPGTTRVVCQGPASLTRLKKAVRRAQTIGFTYRSTEKPRKLSSKQAAKLVKLNTKLLAACKYSSIQKAVTASGNQDRVVIMPGLYTEPDSRKMPTNDPACRDLKLTNDRGDTGAVSYAYQVKCPNDQNLIAVMGRKVGSGKDPQPPLMDRHVIPNTGVCIRCNLQMEGSGPGPDDVIIDAGRVASGDKGPIDAVKDVGIRADRADGFVLRNVKVRHAREHNIYVLETDGMRVDRFKSFYAGEYGILTFVEDHALIADCETAGAGDSGIYPGAAADLGEQTNEAKPRYGNEVRDCDSHHNASGFSATAGNAIWVHGNNFYDNALGFTTDVFTAAGHPGFPDDSDLIEGNSFYSNNFNPYVKGSDVDPSVPVPVGTGLWIAGGNNHTIRNNRFYDNWRRGTMLFSVPDQFVCGPAAGGNEQAGCDASKISTSHRNKFYGNNMGVDPSGKSDPNGTDFWWDNFAGNANNCWHDNKGKAGTAASVTTAPANLPSNCATSMGTGDPAQEAELLGCLAAVSSGGSDCPWFTTPPEPKP
jgi:hypothetical protein